MDCNSGLLAALSYVSVCALIVVCVTWWWSESKTTSRRTEMYQKERS